MKGTPMKISLYCTCGFAMRGNFSGFDKARVQQLRADVAKQHTGPGHKLCDAKTAARKRRRDAALELAG